MASGREKYLYPVTVPADARSIVVTHEGVDHTVSVAAQDWYVHAETATGDFPGLLFALSQALSLATGSTYIFLPGTPSRSPAQAWAGLLLANVEDRPFSLKFSDPAFTLDPRLLGFASGQADDVVASSGTHSQLPGPATMVRSDFTYLGAWRSWTRLSSVLGAYEKMSRPTAVRAVSSPRPTSRRVLTWYEERIRTLKYQWVPGAHVHKGMASRVTWANAGQLGVGDVHNQFEDLWDAMARGKTCRLVHYERGESLTLFYSVNAESVVLVGDNALSDLGALVSKIAKGGDFYNITLELSILSGGYVG